MIESLQERYGTNTLIGILILATLFTYVGQDAWRYITGGLTFVGDAPPCAWLPQPDNLGNHQSLIGRAIAQDGEPLQLKVKTSKIPTNSTQQLTVYITVINRSIGSVPFVYSPDQVIVGDNGSSGLGIVFDPPSNIITEGINRGSPTTYPNDSIRILGPRQRCVHRMDFEFDQLDATLRSGNVSVTAYYRGENEGIVPSANPTPVYPDQGLWTGVQTSVALPIPFGDSTSPP